jgi:hypothetical protein
MICDFCGLRRRAKKIMAEKLPLPLKIAFRASAGARGGHKNILRRGIGIDLDYIALITNLTEGTKMTKTTKIEKSKYEIMDYGEALITRAKMKGRHNCRSTKKQKQLKSILVLIAFTTVVLIGLMFYSDMTFASTGAIADPATKPGLMAAPAGTLNNYADYLFVLALPFGVLLLVNQCVLLKQIRNRVK